MPTLAEDIERLAAEGAEPFYERRGRGAGSSTSATRGGAISLEDMGGYRAIEREPVRGRFCGARNPDKPAALDRGMLICLALEILDRLGASGSPSWSPPPSACKGRTDALREFDAGFADELLRRGGRRRRRPRDRRRAGCRARAAAGALRPARLDHPHHRRRRQGMCAAVTCSNGAGSGVFVPGTAVHSTTCSASRT